MIKCFNHPSTGIGSTIYVQLKMSRCLTILHRAIQLTANGSLIEFFKQLKRTSAAL